MGRFLVLFVTAAVLAFAQAPAKKSAPAKPAKPAAAKQAAAKAAPLELVKKSALDKPTLEAYIRHLLAWFPPIEVKLADPKPSAQLPGFFEIKAHASLGQASQDETFLVSQDGQKVLRATVYEITQNPFKADLDRLKTQFQPSLGTPGAPVVLVLFTDFECPYCREEAKMLRQNLISAYPKQVRLYFKDHPLEQIHPWAKMASIAGRCVFRQNAAMFWDYHDWAFENQEKITPDNLRGMVLDWAKNKEIDPLQLGSCLDTKATAKEVEKNQAEARELGVLSTPTIFVNGRRLVGGLAWPDLRRIIDYEIEYQKTARNAGEDACCQVGLQVPGAAAPASGTSLLTGK